MTEPTDRRGKAIPTEVRLLRCPRCDDYGIPEPPSVYGCLRCGVHTTDRERLDALEKRIEELEDVAPYINRPIGGSR